MNMAELLRMEGITKQFGAVYANKGYQSVY